MAAPNVGIQSVDETISAARQNTAIFLVQAITERGVVNKPVRVGSVTEFYRSFGKIIHNSAEECIRALYGGAILWVSPVHHYTDITDLSTIEGDKATATVLTNLVIDAIEVGEGYNGVIIKTLSPRSKRSGFVDIEVSKPTESTFSPQTITDVPTTFNQEAIDLVNAKSEYVSFSLITPATSVTLTTSVTATLAGGAKDITTITDGDLVGNETTKTGLYSFAEVFEGFHMANFLKWTPAVDAAFITYATTTSRDALLHIPHDLTVANSVHYRNGTGTYSHTPIDSLHGRYIAGWVEVPSAKDANLTVRLSGMGDLVGAIARKDNDGVWFSVAQKQYGGSLRPDITRAFVYTQSEKDLLYDNGINFVSRGVSGVKIEGNKSLFRDETKTSSKWNIADLTIYLQRALKTIGEQILYLPNDIPTFRRFYDLVRPTMIALQTGRAIQPDEGAGWIILADQNAKDLDSLQINLKSDVLAGRFKAIIRFVPISATEYVEVTLVRTNQIIETA